MPWLTLKTKLVIAITTMVAALVGVFAYLYVYQVVHTRIRDAYVDGDFVSHEIFNAARQTLEADLQNTRIDTSNPEELRAAIQQTLATDAGLSALLQSIVGYSRIIYDAAIVDPSGRVLLHTDTDMQGQPMPPRPDFDRLLRSGLWRQVAIVYGPPQVYEIRMPLERGGAPFGDIRIGLSTIFMKSEMRPQLNRALLFSSVAIAVSLFLAAGLSNLVLQPLEAIGRRLDRMSAGELELPADRRADEYGVVTTKIDRLGRQMRDVKEIFSALKENLDQIMANLQDGLMLFTRDWRVVLVSASAERFTGCARAEMLGRRLEEVFTRESPLGRLVLDSFERRQPVAGCEIESAGRSIEVALDFIAEGGESIGALLTMRDAESVRRIENEIEFSRRLAAIGRLTSGVAHEVKNPINAIVVHLEVLRETLHDLDPAARRHMDIIGSEIQRLDRVVQTLVDFTRPVELKLAETDLQRAVEEVVLLAAPEAERQGVRIERVSSAAALPVKIDLDLVKQAVLNVVINGVQVMSGGGVLSIRLDRDETAALIEVQDEGPGIPLAIQDKIFNLYFTTKEKGSGIGLAMTYRVMQLHSGSVEFESEPDRGTTFRLRLPLCESPTAVVQEATILGSSTGDSAI